jgi:hypothetical protein
VNPCGLSVGPSDSRVVAGAGSDAGKQAASSGAAFSEVLTEVEGEETPSNELQTSPGLQSAQQIRAQEVDESPKVPENSADNATTDAVALSYALVITMPEADLAVTAPDAVPVETSTQNLDTEQAGATVQLELPEAENRQAPPLKSEKDRKKSEPVPSASIPGNLPLASLPTLPADSNTTRSKPDSSPASVPQTDTMRMALPASLAQSGAGNQNAPVVMEARITPKTTPESLKADNENSEATRTIKEGSLNETPLAESVTRAQSADEHAHKEGHEGSNSADDRQVQTPNSQVFNVQSERVQPEQERAVSTSRVTSQEIARQPYVALNDSQSVKTEHSPLKQMDLRIPDANGDVLVRLQERAGSVHVSVRTSDSVVANNIQDRLPELTRTLDKQGFEAETWTSKHVMAATRVAEAAIKTESSHAAHEISRNTLDQPGALQTESTQTDSDRQDGHRKPDWQEELYKRPRRSSQDNFKEYL